MKRLLAMALLALFASSARAGGNPDIRIYIDFDPPNYVHEITAAPYTTVEAYVCLDTIGEGFTCISFRMEDPSTACPGTLVAPGFTYLLGIPP